MFEVPISARSWVPGADQSGFPIQSLAYGKAFDDDGYELSIVRIGDYVLDLDLLVQLELLPPEISVPDPFVIGIAQGRAELDSLREHIFQALRTDNKLSVDDRETLERSLIPLSEVELDLPFAVNAFVDFYSGIHHARNVGMMFRPDGDPLLPNYRWVPIGYNGRASSVVPSGVPIVRPHGQTKAPNADAPTFGPTKELDFELEMGMVTCGYSEMGVPVPIEDIDDLMLGLMLVNDWSARDFQRWEYQPLGPFLAKSFATSVSPWVVPLDALAPMRVSGIKQDPQPLEHLREPEPRAYNIHLEVLLKTARAKTPQKICVSNTNNLYWSFRQQLAHQSSNGTPIMPGDLYATGTISAESETGFGSLLELSWKGTKPLTIEETGETRTFLEDGDTVFMRGWTEGDGYQISLGEVQATIVSEAVEG